MFLLKRLRILPAVLGVAAVVVTLGTTLFGEVRDSAKPLGDAASGPAGATVDEMATRFSKQPVVTYSPKAGETIFAWQLKPELPPAAVRPRDVLVIVDTSASQAGKPIAQAKHIITALAAASSPDDRFALWTLNTPTGTRPLTAGLQAGNSEDLRVAAANLSEVEYGSGATDLKGGLNRALATLPPNPGRQQLVLFLGDGESSFEPVTEADRLAIGGRMDLNDVFFFAVPLGIKVNPYNLHGLAALTGGSVVRLQEDLENPSERGQFVGRLKAAFDVPVFKADKFQFGDGIAEVYPSKLPPLRADKGTLVMGKLTTADGNVTLTANGTVARAPVALNLSQPVPMAAPEHFFLYLMLDQWRNAPNKEAPAVLQSDRALALASTQVKLYRNEYLTQAVWAVTMNKLDDAANMYQAAHAIDPTDAEASAGIQLVEKMKAGTITKADLDKRIAAKSDALKVGKDETQVVRLAIQDTAAQPPAGQPQPGGAQPLPPNAADLLQEAAAKRKIEEEKFRVIVDQTIRRARQLLRTDPDAAYQDLKRQRDDILGYEGIGDQVRTQLVGDLEATMREIFVKGAQIKREAAAEREQIARTRQRLNEFDRAQNDDERTKARIDAFRQLMQQARYELAYQEAQLMIQERVAKGEVVPNQAVASYIIGQQATQLREWKELVRIREDRFLLAMMQTEKSHIPYPDEPPVHFPPAAVWRELTGNRKERYSNMMLGPEASPTQRKLQSIVENSRVSYEKNLNDTPLFEMLQDLAKRHDVTFIIMEEYFKVDGIQNIREAKPNLTATRLEGLTLGSFLDIVLQSINATFIVRPDYIEITTFNRRLEEKVTRVFPVADLVVPIPNAVVQSQLIQNLSIQNQTLAIFGAASLYGGGLSNFLGGNNNNNNGGGGGNPFGGGQQGQNQGNPFFGGQNQGGIVGLGGGGNVGQFGNLGGQFGLQGQGQEDLLLQLIFETVAKGEWANVPPPPGGQPGGGGGFDEESFLPVPQRNSLGYYPPARALIVRGTSRYHGNASVKLKGPGGFAAAPAQRPDGGVVVIGPGGNVNPPKANPANPANPNPVGIAAKPAMPTGPIVIGADTKPQITDPKLDPDMLAKKLDKDPRRMWQQAVDWTVSDPGLIVASAEFLIEMNEPAHAVEILKAGLRKGLATDDWAHEALAVAFQMTQSNPTEAERAALSGIDLDPSNVQAFLRAAKAEAALKNFDYAFTLCERAAVLAPDRPESYANALVYAESAKDVKSDSVAWAADNLLHRDWSTADGIDYHQKARDRVDVLVKKYEAAGLNADALKKTQIEQTRRDLVVEVLWQGAADLDLFVTEPSGAVCSSTQKRTSGGGFLKADLLEQKDEGDRSESYTAASAFSGTYKIGVRQAFGRPVGGSAIVKVTRFKGTPQEAHDLLAIDLNNPQPLEIKLEGGSRTELATVSDDANEFLRAETTAAPVTSQPSGFGGGVGAAGKALHAPVEEANGPRLPVVVKSREQVLPGLGGAADIRAIYKMNPDRRTYSVTVNPVFATASGKTKLPKLDLLPGSEAVGR